MQCVVWGFRGGPSYLTSNPRWRDEVFRHIDASCGQEGCHLCDNFIVIPPLIGATIKALLYLTPQLRPSAYEVVMALQENRSPEVFNRTHSMHHHRSFHESTSLPTSFG